MFGTQELITVSGFAYKNLILYKVNTHITYILLSKPQPRELRFVIYATNTSLPLCNLRHKQISYLL